VTHTSNPETIHRLVQQLVDLHAGLVVDLLPHALAGEER
jgi:hypothetical protein